RVLNDRLLFERPRSTRPATRPCATTARRRARRTRLGTRHHGEAAVRDARGAEARAPLAQLRAARVAHVLRGAVVEHLVPRRVEDKASIVGSIGVLMDGFGFTGLMDKLGIERRLMTAGENKGFLDPFSPQSDRQREYAQAMLNVVHKQFIDVVRAGRGKRLKE